MRVRPSRFLTAGSPAPNSTRNITALIARTALRVRLWAARNASSSHCLSLQQSDIDSTRRFDCQFYSLAVRSRKQKHSVLVPVVGIRKVLMGMSQRPVAVQVRMLHSRRHRVGVVVQVVLVVDVRVLVLDGFVPMTMRVPFGQMQPHAGSHERAGRGELWRQRIT